MNEAQWAEKAMNMVKSGKKYLEVQKTLFAEGYRSTRGDEVCASGINNLVLKHYPEMRKKSHRKPEETNEVATNYAPPPAQAKPRDVDAEILDTIVYIVSSAMPQKAKLSTIRALIAG